MTDTTHTTHISQVATVFVPVADQECAHAFYLDTLGFEKRTDVHYGEGHHLASSIIAMARRVQGGQRCGI